MLQTTHELLDFFETEEPFISSVEYTANHYGFRTELIEKDFLCSLILMQLYQKQQFSPIFKGGTLLAKVHAGFYRLSEDLDFSLPISHLAKRRQRSALIKPIKKIINNIPENFPIFSLATPLTGSNESRQYNAEFNYRSKMSGTTGKILIEIGLREELLLLHANKEANTLLLDPFSRENKVSNYFLNAYLLKKPTLKKCVLHFVEKNWRFVISST